MIALRLKIVSKEVEKRSRGKEKSKEKKSESDLLKAKDRM